jgi:hypothetical protein
MRVTRKPANENEAWDVDFGVRQGSLRRYEQRLELWPEWHLGQRFEILSGASPGRQPATSALACALDRAVWLHSVSICFSN